MCINSMFNSFWVLETSTFIMNLLVVWITKACVAQTLRRSCFAVFSNAGEAIVMSHRVDLKPLVIDPLHFWGLKLHCGETELKAFHKTDTSTSVHSGCAH